MSTDRILLALIAALIVTLAVFALWPGLDLSVAHHFYDRGGFLGKTEESQWARDVFRITPIVLLAALVLAWGVRRVGVPLPFAPDGRAVVFLIAAMAIGPGLIVNVGMKDHLHRPRPVHVQEFGGDLPFKPWYEFDGGCQKNCSFASGESSQGFWMVAPALLVPAPFSATAMGAALAFGFGAGALRLAFGGHFLSDAIVGGLITLIVIFALRRLMWPKPR